jgi:hypothetical protein
MYITPEFLAAVIFGVIMIIIGLAAIWMVIWQTRVMQRHKGMHLVVFPSVPTTNYGTYVQLDDMQIVTDVKQHLTGTMQSSATFRQVQ